MFKKIKVGITLLTVATLMGCASRVTPVVMNEVALTQLWEGVQERQPIIQGKGDITIVVAQDALDHCNYIISDTDENVWDSEDYWATPKESRAKGAGDCEDIAICMYYYLREHGATEGDMMLLSGSFQGEGHAVILVDTIQGSYVLDSNYTYPIKWEYYISKLFNTSVIL